LPDRQDRITNDNLTAGNNIESKTGWKTSVSQSVWDANDPLPDGIVVYDQSRIRTWI
jgi:hypothetical protein